MKWVTGLTTVLPRRDTLLPRTLYSLCEAGFSLPRLFVDGATHEQGVAYERDFGLPVTVRNPKLRTYGNWVLGLAELWIRDPHADRYAIFQDDLIACKGLRAYLEASPYPDRGYLNLYTFPHNQRIAPTEPGWFEGCLANVKTGYQRGLGAVALVFSAEAVMVLLAAQSMVERVQDSCVGGCPEPPAKCPDGRKGRHKGWKKVDGAIVHSMNVAGWREYVHNPSLVQHTGAVSSTGNMPHPLATSWRGDGWDATSLLRGTT